MRLFKYKVIRVPDGKRPKTLYLHEDEAKLRVGGEYTNLGKGYPGIQKVLEKEEVKGWN
jgi:hypothetical protein